MESPLPEAEIAHHVPGRLRLKIPSIKGNPEALDQIRQSLLSHMPGVRDISFNTTTGSVIVNYEEEHHETAHAAVEHHAKKHLKMKRSSAPEVGKVTHMAAMIEQEAVFLAEHSHAARAVVDFCQGIDQTVKRASGNAVDLKVLVPLGLAVITFLEIGAGAATPVWLTLGLFSLNHFVELHAHDDEDDDEPEADEPTTR